MHIPGRRNFIKNAVVLAPFLTLFPSQLSAKTGVRLRVAFIGAGPWGRGYMVHALAHPDMEVRAVAEYDEAAVKEVLKLFRQSGAIQPDLYVDGPQSYQQLLLRKDIDAVVIATPWNRHYEIAAAALRAGKHVACGPVMGTTLAEHWDIVHLSEQTGRQYVTLDEHSCQRELMAVSEMVSQGVFGTLETVYAGARHYLPEDLSAASPYPVYPAAAAAKMLGASKGNRFVSLSVQHETQEYVISKPHVRTGEPLHIFTRGPVHTICLTTAGKQTLWLQQERGNDLPVSMGFRIKGTQGAWMNLTRSLHITGKSDPSFQWERDRDYLEQYDAPQWQEAGSECAVALQQFIRILKAGPEKELPVYAAATNSIIGPLSLLSAQQGGAVIRFPDFSNGKTAS